MEIEEMVEKFGPDGLEASELLAAILCKLERIYDHSPKAIERVMEQAGKLHKVLESLEHPHEGPDPMTLAKDDMTRESEESNV